MPGLRIATPLSLALLACTSPLAITPALAQQPVQTTAPEAPPASEGRTVYGPDYFLRYNPATSEDILRIIPGVSTILDASSNAQARGFGSGGARILANGRRFPGKANDLVASLRRIPASSVARVELISGSASGISVQSEGILVNLVMKEGASIAGSGSWEVNLRGNDEGKAEVDGLLSYNGSIGAIGYTLGIERNVWSPPTLGSARYSNRFRDEVYYYPDGLVLERRPQAWDRQHDKWIYTGGLTYDFVSGDRLQLNAFYQTLDITEIDRTNLTRFSRAGAITLQAEDAHTRITGQRTTLEIGSEYDAHLGPGELHALAIVRRDKQPVVDFRSQTVGSTLSEISRSESQVDTGEDILRASWRLPIFDKQSIEFGAEGARNTLDQNLEVFQDRNADGRVEPVAIPTAIAHVEENRGEAFITHRLPLGALSIESSLTYEASKITNNYPFSPERELSFLRPRVDARYSLSPATKLRFLVDRTISQLDFTLFVPKFDFVDNEIDAGNPGIEPEKTWVYEAGIEHRLPSDGGILEARVFYKDITDAIDKIPLTDTNGFFSADGNLPSASITGAEVKASLRLDRIGVPDALLSLRHTWQTSETTDPFTGEDRRLKSDFGNNYEIGFRQDLTGPGISYGFTYTKVGSATITSDLLVREYFRVGPTLIAFVEKRVAENLTFRLEAQNLAGATEEKSRYLYAINAFDGALRRYEHWDEDRDTRFAARLSGRF